MRMPDLTIQSKNFPSENFSAEVLPAIRTRYFDIMQFHLLSITATRFSNLQLLLVVFDEIVQESIN